MSQEELASQAEVSVRHLSYVETGRSSPSRELVIAVACALGVDDVGLFLEAAGFLAPYSDFDPASPQMQALSSAMRSVVDRQPHPALIHDRFGTIHCFNAPLIAVVQSFLAGDSDTAGVAQAQGGGHHLLAALRPFVANWDEVAALYRRRLFRELVRGGADLADELLEELYRDLYGPDAKADAAPQITTPLVLKRSDTTIRFDLFTTTLGTPQDITLRNYRLVLFIPADAPTHQALRDLGDR